MAELEHRFLLTGIQDGQLGYRYEILDARNTIVYGSDRFACLEEAEEEALLMLQELRDLTP